MDDMVLPSELDDDERDAREGFEQEVAERETFLGRVREMAWQETKRRLGLRPDQHPHSPHALNPASPAAKELHLTHLEVVSDVLGAMHPLADDIAARAGRAGAGYPELGEAAGGISRQAARKRWPGAAGTQWSLYLLTGSKPPRGMAVRMFRSHDKATEAGRTAVGDDPFSDDGVIAAVVVNCAREAVWACYLDGGTCSPEEITLPEDLHTVPATGDAGHADWVHRWEQHIARQP
ncbi:hypothetical protein ACWDYK_15745 [Streptomyces anthocyanicus]|uniref:hypothetical protein n=1 Tax=Streptomyces anthocyanicus TaxID=68174 RepID=UPI002F911B3F|nr:hypothetical protein OHA15_41725 [Streptomyces anthocyanicus]